MLSLLTKAIRERLSSRLWWSFIALAIASFFLFRAGMRMWGLSALGAAQRKYREFLAQRRVHLYERLVNLPGANKFLAIIKARNPNTGDIATDTVWLMADTAEQAYQRVHAGEWGKDFKLVSMSSSGVSVDLPALAKKGEGLLDWWTRAKAHPEEALAAVAKKTARVLTAAPTRTTTPLGRPKLGTVLDDAGFMDDDTPTVVIDDTPKARVIPRKQPEAAPSLLAKVVTSPPVVNRETWAQFRVTVKTYFNDGSDATNDRTLNYVIGTRQERIEEIALNVEQSAATQSGNKVVDRIELVNIESLEPEKVRAWHEKFGNEEREEVSVEETTNPDSKTE